MKHTYTLIQVSSSSLPPALSISRSRERRGGSVCRRQNGGQLQFPPSPGSPAEPGDPPEVQRREVQ